MIRRWLVYATVLVLVTLFAGCVDQTGKEIQIGSLVDLSGPLTTYGEDIKTTVTIASEEINRYFEKEGKPYRVKLYFEDTKVDPKIALDKVMALHTKGVKLIIGPMGSGEVKNIIEYSRSNKIIIGSPSSTAETKYIGVTSPEEKKYIFRFVATDSFQTKAIAKLAQDKGIKAVVITYIGNAWGKGLEEFGRFELQNQGIEVESSVEYPDPPPADFTPYIATIENDVNALLKNYTSDKIAVVAFSYEEVATMLSQTKDSSVLLNISWIGCDGTAKSSKVVSDIPGKASRVKLYSTVSETRGGKDFDNLNSTYYSQKMAQPKSYGMNAYDATWVFAMAYAEVYDKLGKYDADAMAEAVPKVAGNYSAGKYGVEPVSGEVKFNEYNDRIGSEYRIYEVSDGNWKEIGVWKFTTNEIVWS